MQLERSVAIEATFLVDADTPWRALRMELSRAGDAVGGLAQRVEPTTDGRARAQWSQLPLGRYQLRVHASADSVPLVDIDGIELHGDGEPADPRLRDIDLRGRATRCVLRFVDESGHRIEAHRVQIRCIDRASAFEVSLGRDGFEIALRGPIDLAIASPGFKSRELRAVSGSMEVRLEPASRYRLHCAALLPAPTELRALIRPVDERTGAASRTSRNVDALTFDAESGVEWTPTSDGIYELTVHVAQAGRMQRGTAFEPRRLDTGTPNSA